MQNSSIRIAIIGGGLAGATLANALIHIPHVDINVYESAPEFSERGAAVVLTSTAQRSLARAIPSARDILSKAGAVPMNSSRLLVGSGPEAGAVILDLGQKGDPNLVIHRASLLRELLSTLPRDILHANKRLASIAPGQHGVLKVAFEDGSEGQFDAVIGADGIFGNVRKHVLGDNAEAHSASPAGFWDSRNLVPYEKAKAVLGEEYFAIDRQFGWVGDNAFIMHDILENRTMVQCIISAVENNPSGTDRKHPLTRESLNQTLSTWLDGPIAKGMIDLILDQEDPHGYSQWDHKSTPTYANGPVCIVGDAAHAMTPWQGFGAGMAIEDAMVLGFLFRNSDDVDAVFRAFDEVRRPRCEQIIHSSQGTGDIICGVGEEVGLNLDKFRESLAPRWHIIDAIDYEAHEQEALSKLRLAS